MTGDKMRLLIVDDDEGDVLIMQESLKKAPFAHDIAVARSGQQALDYLHRRPPYQKAPRPDLVLLDINMPGMNGLEVLRRVKSDPDLQRIPVCMLTTSDAYQDIVDAYAHHANCYVTKPVELQRFILAVREVAEFWTQVAKLPTLPSVPGVQHPPSRNGGAAPAKAKPPVAKRA
jgi:two-component system response regulator